MTDEQGKLALVGANGVERHGRGIERRIYIYRLYYSAIGAVCKGVDEHTYWWCGGNFRQHERRYRRLMDEA